MLHNSKFLDIVVCTRLAETGVQLGHLVMLLPPQMGPTRTVASVKLMTLLVTLHLLNLIALELFVSIEVEFSTSAREVGA